MVLAVWSGFRGMGAVCGVSGTRETHWRRRRRRRGDVDGSRIELGEVWRGRWRERRDKKGGVDKNGKRQKQMSEVQIKMARKGDKKRWEKGNLAYMSTYWLLTPSTTVCHAAERICIICMWKCRLLLSCRLCCKSNILRLLSIRWNKAARSLRW